MNKVFIALLALIFFGIAGLISSYNSLVSSHEAVTSKWSQVENQLQRRNDLIPNLVNTVKGYTKHEEKVFSEVADAHKKMLGAGTPAEATAANAELSGALSRLIALGERYPDLKANQNFTLLQDELAGTENRIAVARQDYNNAVQSYNASIKRIPTVFFAQSLGFGEREYFNVEEKAKENPKVQF